jgi:hypothetical protein
MRSSARSNKPALRADLRISPATCSAPLRLRGSRVDWTPFGAWRSLVARTVRVGEVPGSNPGAPIGAGGGAVGVNMQLPPCKCSLPAPCKRCRRVHGSAPDPPPRALDRATRLPHGLLAAATREPRSGSRATTPRERRREVSPPGHGKATPPGPGTLPDSTVEGAWADRDHGTSGARASPPTRSGGADSGAAQCLQLECQVKG